jgi:Polyketide synthase dehydratase
VVACALTDPADESLRYQARALLAGSGSTAPRRGPGAVRMPRALPRPDRALPQLQREWLFHGPAMHAVAEVIGLGPDGIRAALRPGTPRELVPHAAGAWTIGPLAVDGAFQLAILWARAQLDMTPLPTGFARYEAFAPLDVTPLMCEVRATPSTDGHLLRTDIDFSDGDGALLGRLTGMGFACSRELNRLAGAAV